MSVKLDLWKNTFSDIKVEQELVDTLAANQEEVVDVSYGNDECPSILFKADGIDVCQMYFCLSDDYKHDITINEFEDEKWFDFKKENIEDIIEAIEWFTLRQRATNMAWSMHYDGAKDMDVVNQVWEFCNAQVKERELGLIPAVYWADSIVDKVIKALDLTDIVDTLKDREDNGKTLG